MFAKSHTEMCFLLFLLFASVLKTCDQHDCLCPYILVQRNFMENVENIDIWICQLILSWISESGEFIGSPNVLWKCSLTNIQVCLVVLKCALMLNSMKWKFWYQAFHLSSFFILSWLHSILYWLNMAVLKMHWMCCPLFFPWRWCFACLKVVSGLHTQKGLDLWITIFIFRYIGVQTGYFHTPVKSVFCFIDLTNVLFGLE